LICEAGVSCESCEVALAAGEALQRGTRAQAQAVA